MATKAEVLTALAVEFQKSGAQTAKLLNDIALASGVPALALKANEFAMVLDWVPRRVASAIKADELAAENAAAAVQGVKFGQGAIGPGEATRMQGE